MRLRSLTATPHPAGNQIVISWDDPAPAGFPGVRVMRRADGYPGSPTDGVLVAHGTGLTRCVDTGLKGETTYYYRLFPFTGSPPAFDLDQENRVAAPATSPFGYADQMYALLPALYLRYDTRGLLRRMLDLPGGQLDQLRSLAQALLNQHDVDRVDGALLSLLAQWIGWRPDLSVDLGARRAEVRNAPAVYRAIGLVPTVEATVKRILGRDCVTKEYGANVAHSNAPERRTLWMRQRSGAGTWSTPEAPLSLDTAHQGRPAAATDSSGTRWLVYHALNGGRWQIRFKSAAADGFGPSRPLSPSAEAQFHPTVAVQGTLLWAFWSVYDQAAEAWEIRYRIHDGVGWSDDVVFSAPGVQRRRPAATADASGGIWLFWQERRSGGWIFRYARHDGTAWSQPVTFPLDGGASPRVEDDPIAIGGVTGSAARLWLFWACREAGGPWTVVYRTKSTLVADASGWSAVTRFSIVPTAFDDREPAPAAVAGRIELFWSSNRGGAWSIWQSVFDQAAGMWATPAQVTTGPHSERGPAVLPSPSGLSLFTGSNRAVTYASDVYRATRIVDRRYSGSTTVDTRNTAKLALRGRLSDFAVYTYSAGRVGLPTDADRYAYDAVGIFLSTAIDLPNQAGRSTQLDQVRQALSAFLPAHVRAILIDSPS
ncbi:hypothetical protein ACIBG8_42985 [Nonomuraea sp. NPDC050556]|uniref:hypothetical protein n=1 Tax=Nonomuraea sp. NPDC050556 TaxID=3364369 RepID=UPI00378B0AC5